MAVVVGFTNDQQPEANLAEICDIVDELHLFYYMEEGYGSDWIIDYVGDKRFTRFVKQGKLKWHCTHMDPYTTKEPMHYEFPGYMRLTGIQPTNYNKSIDRLFCCQQQSLGYHRDYLLDKLYDNQLLETGYVSYSQIAVGDDDDSLHKRYLESVKNKPLHRNWEGKIVKWFDYAKHDPVLVYDYFDNPPPPLDVWNKSVFNLVTESYYDIPVVDTTLLSEKTYSCLFQAQPFLLVTCKNMHKHLEDEGYKLHHDVFDYSFDAHDTIEQRIDSIVNQVKDLNNSTALHNVLEKTAKQNQEIHIKKMKNMKLPDILYNESYQFLTRAKKLKHDVLYAKSFVDNIA